MTLPQYNITKKRLKKLPDDLIEKVEGEVKAILHAHRDALRNRGMDSIRIPWDVTCGYFGEAFGIFRALHIMGYGYHGAHNVPAIEDRHPKVSNVKQDRQNLNWWMGRLQEEVLQEEGFEGNHECAYCFKKWGKDDTRGNRRPIDSKKATPDS